MVLKTLDSMGPLPRFRIALRIQQVSEDLLQLNQGRLYPALLRLEAARMDRVKWGVRKIIARQSFTPDPRRTQELNEESRAGSYVRPDQRVSKAT